MSKVKKEIIEAAVVKLMTTVTSTMPTAAHKFLLGSMSALATFNNSQKIDQLLGMASDKDGYIDLDAVKAVIDGGFKASGGKISVELFREGNGLVSLLVKPITLTITRDDIGGLMAEVEQHAIKDVRLSNESSSIHQNSSSSPATISQ